MFSMYNRIPFESAIVCTDNITFIVFSMHYHRDEVIECSKF